MTSEPKYIPQNEGLVTDISNNPTSNFSIEPDKPYNKMNMEEKKAETLRLYHLLPPDEEGRKARTDIRDRIIEINYTFFGYVATHTFINNSAISYEDKFQSALSHFCECWWWYQYAKRYRCDLSFTVFFRPRVSEMIERELNEVKYSIRRSLCMEAGAQLGKHWAKVTYDDLSHVKLPVDKMNSLKAIFGTLYWADLETHELYIPSEERVSTFEYPSDMYNDVKSFLIHEMCDNECKLTDKMLSEYVEEYGLDFEEMKRTLPEAEAELYKKLRHAVDMINLQEVD